MLLPFGVKIRQFKSLLLAVLRAQSIKHCIHGAKGFIISIKETTAEGFPCARQNSIKRNMQPCASGTRYACWSSAVLGEALGFQTIMSLYQISILLLASVAPPEVGGVSHCHAVWPCSFDWVAGKKKVQSRKKKKKNIL